ncbi:MAG: RDD family protein [Gammaproteobacteria bacterium]
MQEQELSYAGFWIRAWASIIDTLLIMIVTIPLLIWIYGWDYSDVQQAGALAGPADFLISWVMPAVAVIAFWINRQATPGKMAISAKIVDAVSGNAPTNGQMIGRYFAYFISTIPLCLGFLWIAFDKKKQGWHDKLAGTVVVRTLRRGTEPVKFG